MALAAVPDELEPINARRFEWERVVRCMKMPPELKLTALVLATYANGDGTGAHPGRGKLAEHLDVTERTVRRRLDVLRADFQLIAKTPMWSGRGRGRKADEYRLTMPATEAYK